MQVPGRNSNINNKKGWLKWTVLVVAWLLIISLIKDLWQVKKGFSRIEETKERLTDARIKNEELKKKMDLVSTDEYKEKLIREQLNMQKIGEVVAVLPKTNATEESEKAAVDEERQESWQKWWLLVK